MNNVKTLTYVENFDVDLSSADALACCGVKVDHNVLRGLSGYETVDDTHAFMGIAGVGSKYLFMYNNKSTFRYNGERFNQIMMKIPVTGTYTEDACYDVYRDVAYIALDNDGVIRYDENASSPMQRWAFHDHAIDLAIANERVVMLTDNGFVLRFSECGGRVHSDVEMSSGFAPTITLPTPAQAVVRLGFNALYVLGDTCYKAVFSANEQDIKLEAVASGIGSVLRHTVAQVGDKIIFASRKRLYCLCRDKITPIFPEIRNVVRDFEGARAREWRGAYALSVLYGQERRTYLLDVDKSKCVAMLWNDVFDVTTFNGQDFMLAPDGALVCVNRKLDYPLRFVRTGINFGTESCKYLRRVNVTTKNDIQLRITRDDNTTQVYNVRGSDKPQVLNVNGKSRAFNLEIRSDKQTEVTALSLTAEAYKEAYYGN